MDIIQKIYELLQLLLGGITELFDKIQPMFNVIQKLSITLQSMLSYADLSYMFLIIIEMILLSLFFIVFDFVRDVL